MRSLILIPMLLLPLSACMTQRDQTIWAEFKAEMNGDKPAEAEMKTEAANAEAASEAVSVPAK